MSQNLSSAAVVIDALRVKLLTLFLIEVKSVIKILGILLGILERQKLLGLICFCLI